MVEDPVGLDAPVREWRRRASALLAEQARVGEIGHPGLALGGARRAPRLEAGLAHGDGRLAHLLGAAAAVRDDALEEVGGLLLPVDAGNVSRSDAIIASSTP